MEKVTIATADAAAAVGPYVQGVRAGGLVFASGQLPLDGGTGAMPEGIEAQTRQSLANLKAVLEAGGASLKSAIKTTVFLKNMDDFAAMNAIYGEHFPKDPPARSTVEVARLPRGALAEVEAVALVTAGEGA